MGLVELPQTHTESTIQTRLFDELTTAPPMNKEKNAHGS
jgi:hypothetical protein